jgi:polyphosphate kinase 2 (PPK2 family)
LKEQKKRFLERLTEPDKHWKFSAADLEERKFWKDYMSAYEEALTATSTNWAPWYIIPADHKWTARAAVSAIISRAIDRLELQTPKVSPKQRRELEAARKQLERE